MVDFDGAWACDFGRFLLLGLVVLSGHLAAQSQSVALPHASISVFGPADGTFNAVKLFNFSSQALGLTSAPYAIDSAAGALGANILVVARYDYHLFCFAGARAFSYSFEGD
ncbi:MAG: hypothetical protein R3F04_02020 [Lysobacteraceae bacterium]